MVRFQKYLSLLFVCVAVLTSGKLWAWGPTGHDAIAYIAECNLTPKAQKVLRGILDGHSLVYYSSWMDNLRSIPAYDTTSTWHYANVDEGYTYATMPKNARGDVVRAVQQIVEVLHDKSLNDSIRNTYTKFLIHLVGDLHCPMHAGRLSDRGGNDHPVRFFGRPTNLHAVWDSDLIEAARKWNYTEWQQQLDICSKKEQRQMAAGRPEEWFDETVSAAKSIYESTPVNSNLSYDYVFFNTPVVERQILRAGYRLARLLNEIYG